MRSFASKVPLENVKLPSFVLPHKHLLLKVAWKLHWWKCHSVIAVSHLYVIHVILMSVWGGDVTTQYICHHSGLRRSHKISQSSYLFCSPRLCCTSTNGPWPTEKANKPWSDQSVKLSRLASLSGGQAFWLFEGRIGLGSCKLPNNLSAQRCTALGITVFQVYLDHTQRFDAGPSLGWITSWKKVLLCYAMNPAKVISFISKKTRV